MPSGRGRPKKPTALKVLHGDFDKDPQRRPKAEPKPDLAAPKPPAHLSVIARHEWRRICKEVGAMNALTLGERGSLEQYCDAYSSWREAIVTLRNEGQYGTNSKTGASYEHAAGKAHRAYSMICHKLLCEFGLTPSSRSRLVISEETEHDEIHKRFFGEKKAQ
jgi:P27 family predicted phage terminase small subunit